jgi:elongation factor P
MILANDIKKGDFLKINHRFFKVTSTFKTKPGKGPAYMNVEMFDINTLKNNPHRFGSDEKVEKIFVETKKVFYCYEEGDEIFFNNELGDDFVIPKTKDQEQLFFPHCEYVNLFYTDDGQFLYYECPPHCILKVIETSSPGNISPNSGRSTKPATLENGVIIQVPNYLASDEKIKIDLRDMTYIERYHEGK